jgi:hypothetical protein
MLAVLTEIGVWPQAWGPEGCESNGGCQQPGKKANKNGHPMPIARNRDNLLRREDQIAV